MKTETGGITTRGRKRWEAEKSTERQRDEEGREEMERGIK